MDALKTWREMYRWQWVFTGAIVFALGMLAYQWVNNAVGLSVAILGSIACAYLNNADEFLRNARAGAHAGLLGGVIYGVSFIAFVAVVGVPAAHIGSSTVTLTPLGSFNVILLFAFVGFLIGAAGGVIGASLRRMTK